MENTAYKESSAPPCQVDELASAMRSIKRHPEGYRGIHLHFSLLDREHKQPFHRRAIATAFNKLVQTKSGQLFWTSTFDIVFICKDTTHSDLDISILAARRAVEDSPILKDYIAAGRDNDLCDWYDLATEMDSFMAMIAGLKNIPEAPTGSANPAAKPASSLKSMISSLNKRLIETPKTEEKKPAPVATTRPMYDPIARKSTVAPMGPIQLDQLERNLINMEIFQMLSNQTAYVIVGDSKPQPIFIEYFISVDDIKNKLMPNYDILADKWLFQRLTRTFDQKLMQTLPDRNLIPDHVISLNMNLETIFTTEFDKFVAIFKQQNSQPLILEIRLFDVLSDIQQYYAARDKLTQLGCRISLDAMDVQSLTVLDRDLLAVDFLKINWKSDYIKILNSPMKDKVIDAIAAQGNMRIILCHCDTEDALNFGKAVGIHMFQGFFVDKKCAA